VRHAPENSSLRGRRAHSARYAGRANIVWFELGATTAVISFFFVILGEHADADEHHSVTFIWLVANPAISGYRNLSLSTDLMHYC
jgi:hypothetical protein